MIGFNEPCKLIKEASIHYAKALSHQSLTSRRPGWTFGYLVPEGDHEVDDDAVGPAETGLDVVLTTAAGASG